MFGEDIVVALEIHVEDPERPGRRDAEELLPGCQMVGEVMEKDGLPDARLPDEQRDSAGPDMQSPKLALSGVSRPLPAPGEQVCGRDDPTSLILLAPLGGADEGRVIQTLLPPIGDRLRSFIPPP